jgi:small subunit ribosomal protein S16
VLGAVHAHGWTVGFGPVRGPARTPCGKGRFRRKISVFSRQPDTNAMVVIRLARGGAKKRPFFNIVVTDSHNRRDGRFIERVGFYNPIAGEGEEALRIAHDRVAFWQQRGAKLSDTVEGLVRKASKQAPATAPAV